MYLNTRNFLIRGLSAAVAVAALAASAAFLAAANAETPHGSRAEVILETHDVTGQPWNASLAGWWGHEGGTTDQGKRPTFLSLDMSDGHGVVDDATTAAVHKALGDGGDFSALRVAFVPYSADGSNERPKVHAGENAGQAFRWFADLGVGSALNGNTNANDFVAWVSTIGEYTQWWQAGRPVQGFDAKLHVLDIGSSGGTTPAANPEGTSILNRWPAGTKVSLVFYVSDGVDKAMPQVPTVKVGPDGRAMTSWLTFETVASRTHPARTSGGYRVLTGAGTGPRAAAKPKAAPTPSAGATPTSSGAQAAGSNGSTASGARGSTGDGGLTGSLPGGKPTFWTLLIVLLGGAVAAVTFRLRR